MKETIEWITVGVKVALTLISAVAGYVFSHQHQQNEDIKLVTELASSSEPMKRMLGAAIAVDYYDQNRISLSFYKSIYTYANNSPDTAMKALVNTGISETAKTDDNLRKAVEVAANSLPIRIYFHIGEPNDRQKAEMIKQRLEAASLEGGSAIVVPGIQHVKEYPIKKSNLRCFRKEECKNIAEPLLQLFRESGIKDIELSDMSNRYETSTAIRPKHFEAWIASQSLANTTP
ncbi:MAG: hypothetical protein HQL82_02255 [Magnetococcales bacterium]|nr:hypothetical protein [Magnetococcales bacterium]